MSRQYCLLEQGIIRWVRRSPVVPRTSSRARRPGHSWRWRASSTALLCATALSVSACRESTTPAREATRAHPPERGDSLARLLRRLLTDRDPVAIAQAITCENDRLISIYGPHEANRIAKEVEETTYSWRDRSALRRVGGAIANHVFRTDCGRPFGARRSVRAETAPLRP